MAGISGASDSWPARLSGSIAGYPGYGWRSAAYGAAVGAAAAGAYGYYSNNCYDAYGNYVCSDQYRTSTGTTGTEYCRHSRHRKQKRTLQGAQPASATTREPPPT